MSPTANPRTSSEQLPASPPMAHTSPSRVVSQQPAPAPTMTTASDTKVTQGEAARLRGGCIPCPDGGCCYIIPIPCCC
ncbi:hypothetical protein C8R47DRAFT_1313816 [Mycena vitilis]|nr:hypothetical protein C8R47DRAFT_1313816 [Mycena vitilis]